MTVTGYQKTLRAAPQVEEAHNISVHKYRGLEDAHGWLDLRRSALADQTRHGRDWTLADLTRELLDKPWFNSSHFWLALPIDPKQPAVVAGSIVLQLNERELATIHWLLVAPAFCRQRVGSHLLQLAETAAWRHDRRQVRLETLSSWRAACCFYEAHDYRRT